MKPRPGTLTLRELEQLEEFGADHTTREGRWLADLRALLLDKDTETIAARMAAETISAQQAELRRLESNLAFAIKKLNVIADNCVDWTADQTETFCEKAVKELKS